MLYPTTCVGLRYGCRADMRSGFSREYDYPRSRPPPGGRPYCRPSARGAYFTTPLSAYTRQRAVPSARGGSTAPSPRRSARQSRNLDRVSRRPRPLGWGLGPDLPRDDRHCPGNLGLAAGRVLAALVVTYTYICLSGGSSGRHRPHSAPPECSPTDAQNKVRPAPSVPALYPIIIHARTLD